MSAQPISKQTPAVTPFMAGTGIDDKIWSKGINAKSKEYLFVGYRENMLTCFRALISGSENTAFAYMRSLMNFDQRKEHLTNDYKVTEKSDKRFIVEDTSETNGSAEVLILSRTKQEYRPVNIDINIKSNNQRLRSFAKRFSATIRSQFYNKRDFAYGMNPVNEFANFLWDDCKVRVYYKTSNAIKFLPLEKKAISDRITFDFHGLMSTRHGDCSIDVQLTFALDI